MKRLLPILLLAACAAWGADAVYYSRYDTKRYEHVIASFDSLGGDGWIKNRDSAVYETDASRLKYGTRGIRVKTNGRSSTSITKYNISFPDSLHFVSLSYCYKGNAWENVGITLYFSSDSSFSTECHLSFRSDGNQSAAFGWSTATAHKKQFSNTFNWSTVRHVRIVVSSPLDSSTFLTFGKLTAPKPTPPSVLFTFDDGMRNILHTTMPVLKQRGFLATAFVIGNNVKDTVPGEDEYGAMTLSELHELQDSGWTIGSHSWTHARPETCSVASAVYEVKTNYDWLKANGFKGYPFYAYPYGAYAESTMHVTKRYQQFARTIRVRSTEHESDTIAYGEPGQFSNNLFSHIIGIGPEKSFRQYLRQIDTCIKYGTTAILCLHWVDPNNFGPLQLVYNNNFPKDSLGALCDSLKVRVDAGKVKVQSFEEYFSRYKGQ